MTQSMHIADEDFSNLIEAKCAAEFENSRVWVHQLNSNKK